MAFHFEKPDGFGYKAGQFADYTLRNPPETDEEGNTRGFTLSSAPFEDHLAAMTRLRDTAFKRVLKNSPIGTEVELDAPTAPLHCTTTLHAPPFSSPAGSGSRRLAVSFCRLITTRQHTRSWSSTATKGQKTRRIWMS